MNKIDSKRVKYDFPRASVTIVWSLWRHQQSILMSSVEGKPKSETWDRYMENVVFLSTFMDSLGPQKII